VSGPALALKPVGDDDVKAVVDVRLAGRLRRWHFARPPGKDPDYEMDVRGIAREIVL
jgi:hypothetical protein